MATNIDKSLNRAPMGIEFDSSEEGPIEIEIIDDPEVESNIEATLKISTDVPFEDNLAEYIPNGVLTSIAGDLSDDIDNDRASRGDWEKSYKEGLKLMGLQYEERTEPWNGACGVFHPMITEAVVRFQAETITEMFPAAGPVRTKIVGEETPEKKAAAQRVEDDMNNELTEVMREFRPEQERMLWSLPATGSAFKKVYFDPSLNRQVSMFLPAEAVLLPYGATDLDTCYRVTHEMRKTKNEIVKLQKAGFYIACDLPDTAKDTSEIQQAKDRETGFRDSNDDRYTVYESHVDLDIEGFEDLDDDGEPTGIALPYVVTFLKESNDILAIRRNWLEEDVLKLKRQHFVHYQYIPGFGAYGFGLFHLIGGFAKSATSIMRQLVDAGTLANLPGGLKSRGLRIKGDDTPISPGEFRDVDIGSGTLRDNILPLPYKEPSNVLYQLLGNIVEEGRRFASTADMKVSDMSAQAPVGTTLALLERQLKVMSAVQARLHYSFKQELRLLAAIIRDYTDEDYEYDPSSGDRSAKKTDYDACDIIPVSDPNAATMSQRVVQYQAVMQMAQSSPDIYNMPQLHRNMLEILGIKNADKLVPLPDDMKPKDPVTENQAILKGEPVAAVAYQDHQSHITVHQAMMQDPTIAAAIGQNPKAPAIMAALQTHIADHTGYMYRRQIEAQLGMPMPPEDQELPPQIEMALSGMLAQAAQQQLQQSKAQAAQQQAQQQAQDPLIQMQQQELQLKMQELQLKQQKLGGDQQIAQAKLQLEQQKAQLTAMGKADELHLQENIAKAELELEKAKFQMQEHRALKEQTFQQESTGLKLGAEISKNKTQQEFQARQSAMQQQQQQKPAEDDVGFEL